MSKTKRRVDLERKSTTDRYGIGTVKVREDYVVLPPSHLLKERVCPHTGGAFLKKLKGFLDSYYRGKVVLGRSRSMKPIKWEDSGIGRSFDGFFMDYPPIIRDNPFTIFKETRPVKCGNRGRRKKRITINVWNLLSRKR